MADSELNIQSHISTMDITTINQSGSQPPLTYIIVGGRDTLKLVELSKDKKMSIKQNLRKSGNKQAIGYVEFNRTKPELLAAASVQGSFSIWDVNAHQENFYEKSFHTSAINRMNWRDQKTLISGGQDYLINLYDISQRVSLVWQMQRNDAIRDVRFNPKETYYFMAAYNSGLLEYYDIRMGRELVCMRSNTDNSVLINLDWNSQEQNVLAGGFTEKEIKIWYVQDNSEIIEKLRIQHIDGTSLIRWHENNPKKISVASLNRDISVTTYDISQPYRPISVMKNHTDVITSFIFADDEKAMITGSRDQYMKYQRLDTAIKVYDKCPKFPVTISQYNTLVFKLEDVDQQFNQFPRRLSSMEDDISSKNYDIVRSTMTQRPLIKGSQTQCPISHTKQTMISQRNLGSTEKISKHQQEPTFFGSQQNVWNPRTLTLIPNVFELFAPEQLPIQQELAELQMKYDIEKNFKYNASIAKLYQKPKVASFWIALEKLIDEFYHLSKEVQHKQVLVNSRVQRISPITKDDQSEEDTRSPNLGITSSGTLQKVKSEKKSVNQIDLQELQRLHEYFETYPAALRQEIDGKNLSLKDDGILHIRTERIPYYKRLLRTQQPMTQFLMNKESMLKALSNSIHDLIQKVIDDGELCSGFWMFAKARQKVQFGKDVVEYWSQSYLDLLKLFGLYSLGLKALQVTQNASMLESSKDKFQFLCTTCTATSAGSKCKSGLQCAICLKPVNGLYSWCPQCGHGGHLQEINEWFETHSDCPTGCGHQCYI